MENAEWVCIFPVIEHSSDILLVREYRHGAQRIVDGLPGGVVDHVDASPETAARRELVEETGYDCRALISLGAVYANWSSHNNRIHCFLALDCHRVGEQDLDVNEEIELLTLPLRHVQAPGFLEQAFHVACLHMAEKKIAELGNIETVANAV